VLPAILNESEYLQTKYSKPIYGTEEIISRNFNRHIWVKFNKTGKVMDPYKTLPRLFEDFNEHDVKLLSESTLQLNNGGLALTAYARMQFTEMSDYERKQLTKGLYKYCELDTMAMVMIHEGWVDMINNPTD
jgi:hypothetical protein